jgi:DNA-binding NarL/FixJ family response regulator
VTEVAIRVVVADDQRVIREGLQTLLGLLDGIDIVGVAQDGAAAVARARDTDADVLLMDLRMPRMDGVEATRQLRAERSRTKVLVLTTYADDEEVFAALRAGAGGYLTKDAGAEEIAAAIRAVHRGETHLDPVVQARLVAAVVEERGASLSSGPASEPGLPDALTPREAEVLRLIARGLSNAEIAEQLVVSGATVKTHINRIFMKIGARDRAQAVRYAFHHGLT